MSRKTGYPPKGHPEFDRTHQTPMKKLFIVCALALATVSARASTDSAYVHTPYFFNSDSFGDSVLDNYAARWRTWLQTYRAIEKESKLADSLLHWQRRQGLKTIRVTREQRKHYNQENLNTIHKRLAVKTISAQSSKVCALQIGRFRGEVEVRQWLHRHWTQLQIADVYRTNQKSFIFFYSSESITKPQYLWEEKHEGARFLYFGLYASPRDAKADSEKLARLLRIKPSVVFRELSPQLVEDALFAPIANRTVDENGDWRAR